MANFKNKIVHQSAVILHESSFSNVRLAEIDAKKLIKKYELQDDCGKIVNPKTFAELIKNY